MTIPYPVSFPSSQEDLLTLSHPSPSTWIIELHNGVDSRLTRNFILNAILPALDHVEREWRIARGQKQEDPNAGKGSLVITGDLSQDKFFSNGLDLQAALAEAGFWTSIKDHLHHKKSSDTRLTFTKSIDVFYPFLTRVLTFPIPTVAAINGHAFAGGWLLAAACDYRVMSSGKCWGSMPEIYLGSDFPYAIIVFLRAKLPEMVRLRKQVLEGHRWTPQELLAAGMVDDIVDGGSKCVLQNALALAEKWSSNAKTGVWGLIKKGVYRDVLEAARLDTRLVTATEDDGVAQRRLLTAQFARL